MSAVERTDETLMHCLCEGDTSALAELVQRYQMDLFRFCQHYLKDVERAHDMVQECFLRVYSARDRFDRSRKFKPWMLCIARNLCLSDLRKKRIAPMESLEVYASAARQQNGEVLKSAADTPDTILIAAERQEMLAEALNSLDEDSCELLTLRYFERMSARDIAEMIGSTEGAVRTKLHRVLKMLRQQYADHGKDL